MFYIQMTVTKKKADRLLGISIRSVILDPTKIKR